MHKLNFNDIDFMKTCKENKLLLVLILVIIARNVHRLVQYILYIVFVVNLQPCEVSDAFQHNTMLFFRSGPLESER